MHRKWLKNYSSESVFFVLKKYVHGMWCKGKATLVYLKKEKLKIYLVGWEKMCNFAFYLVLN